MLYGQVRQAALRTFTNQQVESRTKLTDNSITTGNSWSDPKLRKFGGLIEAIGDSATEKEVAHTSPSVMQISVWPVIRLEPRHVCMHDSHYEGCPPYTIYLFHRTVIHESVIRTRRFYYFRLRLSPCAYSFAFYFRLLMFTQFS